MHPSANEESASKKAPMGGRLAVYRRLLGYLRPYWRQAALAYGAMLLATLLNLLVPQIIKQAIDQGLAAGQARALFYAGGLILLIALVRGGVAFAHRFYGEWLTHRIAYDLRNHFYNSVQSLPFAFHDRAQTGDLMSRATSDITETERFTGIGLLELIATSLLIVGVSVAMLRESVTLALIVMGPLAVLVATAIYFGNTIRPLFRRIQEQMGVLSSTMQESMTGIGVVKAFAREPHELEKFEKENQLWFVRRYESIKLWANYWPTFTFILATSILLLLWFGGPAALRGSITVGSLFAMISYVLMLNAPVSHLGFLVNMAATAGASAGRVFEIIDTPNEVEEAPDAIELEHVRGEVVFERVSFAYSAGRSTLEEISFEAKPGQVVALIGPTGSGKSTIINLIPRFYDPTSGRVLIDGMDVRRLKLKSLRRQIGIVLQAPFLFNATIAENIAYGRPNAPMSEIEAAAKAAAAHDFIMSFPAGYQTMVGERGVTLSGGQKQRIAIARAILCNPRILVLDDSTSSVDTETEHLIQQALAVLMEGRTTFVIAQRLLTLKSADMILVLDKGRIIQRGTHEALLAEGGLYREIYDLQLKDQEEFKATQQNMPAWMASAPASHQTRS
ncbi:MAG TPA: ABC transporter ATP-binding protein [Caldilineaceae bacterium]|nr:ABC transporter ATP-binding protein [Caldilineaceae bacterium]